MRALLVAPLLLVACSEDATYMTVTVDKRDAVHDATKLKVTLTNAGSMRSDDLDLEGKTFPVTFTLSAPGRSGALDISVDALDGDGALVGRGASQTNLDQMMASVVLDSADFVVNSERANDQFLTGDYEAVGFQLAAITNGQWMAIFRDECVLSTSNCEIYGRRYDSSGLPVTSVLAAGDIQFSVSTETTTSEATPAVAANGLQTLAVWDYTASTGGSVGIACRAITDTGASPANQVSIASEATDIVSATGLPMTGNFALTWRQLATPRVTRMAIVNGDCNVVMAPVTISPTTGTFGASRPHVAANDQAILFSWIVDDNLYVRTSSLTGTLGMERRLIDASTAQTIEHARIAPWKQGFALAVRWVSRQSDGPGKIELYYLDNTGVIVGSPILVTEKSRSDFSSNKGFSIARRQDDALMVVWHVCEPGASLCDVFGRTFRPTGAAVGEPFVIPTSTASEQINPSVVALQDSFVAAWNDLSAAPPDTDGTAVRARVITPLYDDARGVHGATCGASAPGSPDCGDGLACAMGTDSVQRCYYECSPPNCPTGGTCTAADTGTACTF